MSARPDVEAIERATVAAVAPPEVLEIGGWLAPLDHGSIGRAKSAVPLSHAPDLSPLDEIVDAYRQRGLSPAFRLADTASMAAAAARIGAYGLAPQQPTLVKLGDVGTLAAFAPAEADILETPDAVWAQVFVGPGFDPADGAHRVQALSRSPGALYAAVRDAGETVAVGAASFGHGWAGIHGMRTHPDHRGRGHASRILATLGQAMQARGVAGVFLQVEEGNPARRIYRQAGFSPAWRYHYWR